MADFYALPIGPGHVLTLLQVSSAVAVDSTHVDVTYNNEARHSFSIDPKDSLNPTNYEFTSLGLYNKSPLIVVAVTLQQADPTIVRVEVDEMTNDLAPYIVTVTNVEGVSGLPLDLGNNTATFYGIGVFPQLDPVATVINNTHIQLTFSEAIREFEAELGTNYVITGGAGLTVATATRTTLNTVVLETSSQVADEAYHVIAASYGDYPIVDLANNPLDPAFNFADFTGVGTSPPYVEFSVSSGTTGIPVRAPLYVHMYDDPDEFSGIDVPNCWIRVDATVAGVVQSSYAVSSGVIQPNFVGEITGNPVEEEGVTFRIRPKYGWRANTDYTVYAYAIDLDTYSNEQFCDFNTAAAHCFEDLTPTTRDPCPLDAILSAPLVDYPAVEKLRKLLGVACTLSSDWQVRARTLAVLASMTELNVLLAGLFNFNWVDVSLCDRTPMLDVHAVVRQNQQVVIDALAEVPQFTPDEKRLVSRYLRHDSSIYVVNTAALIVVMTAAFINENT